MSQPLFDAAREVGDRIARAPHLLLGLNYDGTLTHHVEEPAAAGLPPHTARVLASLAGRERVTLVILSGRERTDLQTRVNIPGAVYAGNHGLEISGPGYLFIEPASAERVDALKQLAAGLTARLQTIPGVAVENKGLTVTVHYRQAPDDAWEEVRRQVHAVLAASSHPFVLTTGEMAFEIRPRVYWGVADALRWVEAQVGKPGALTIYLGDDPADEDAGRALPEGIFIKVGGHAESAAPYYLEGPTEVRKFLEWVDELLGRGAPGPAVTEVLQP